MRSRLLSLCLTLSTFFYMLTSPASAVTIDWVTVGGAGHAADTTGLGAVAYPYLIGKYGEEEGSSCQYPSS